MGLSDHIPLSRCWPAALSCSLLLPLAAGCSSPERAVDDGVTAALIVLTTDTTLHSEQEVAGLLSRIEVLFDAEGGFVPGASVPDLEATDSDGDGEQELLLALDWAAKERLPTIRVDPGSNVDRKLFIRARGLDSTGRVVAYGSAAGPVDPAVSIFKEGELTEVKVRLLLARSSAAARIVAVVPAYKLTRGEDVMMTEGMVIESLAFYASKPLTHESLDGHVHLSVETSTGSFELPIELTRGAGSCPFGVEMWLVTPTECAWLPEGAFKLVIDPEGLDTSGAALVASSGKPAGFAVSRRLPPAADLGSGIGLGPCSPQAQARCVNDGPTWAHDIDLSCDLGTGRLIPAPCTVVRCQDREVFEWVRLADANSDGKPDDPQACSRYRQQLVASTGTGPLMILEGGSGVQHFCVLPGPWSCSGRAQDCERLDRLCEEGQACVLDIPCSDACRNDELLCTPDHDCAPLLGGCAEDCFAFGSCPEFDQQCVQSLDNSGYICRDRTP